jgi:hypothetical protein
MTRGKAEITMTTTNDVNSQEIRTGVRRELDDADPTVETSAIALLRTQDARVRRSLVGAVLARGDVSLAQGGSRTLIAAGNLSVQQGGGGMFLAGGDVEIHQGGSGTLVSLGGVRIRQGGAMVAITGNLDVGEASTVGLALTPRLTVAPGGRVIVGPRQAAIAGLVAGTVAGLLTFGLSRLFRR